MTSMANTTTALATMVIVIAAGKIATMTNLLPLSVLFLLEALDT